MWKNISSINPTVGAKYKASTDLKDNTKYYLPGLGYSFKLDNISLEEVESIQKSKFKDQYFISIEDAAKKADEIDLNSLSKKELEEKAISMELDITGCKTKVDLINLINSK